MAVSVEQAPALPAEQAPAGPVDQPPSASTVQAPVPSAKEVPSAEDVGNAFVHQYYHILHQSPELVHRFYQDGSRLGRPEENGIMAIATTLQDINDKILSLDYGETSTKIKSVDAQDSFNGGVLVLVTGYLTRKDNATRNFIQTFFLAPQDNGYYVLNDAVRYVEDIKHQDECQGLSHVVEAPSSLDQATPIVENHDLEQSNIVLEKVNGAEEYNSSEHGEGSVLEEEVPAAEVVNEVQDKIQIVAEPDKKIEELPKKSYASIVKVMKEGPTPLSNAAPAHVKMAQKAQEQQVPASFSPPPTVAEAAFSHSNLAENGNIQEDESDGYSIYIKGLPLNATPALLDAEFKKFGPIRNGGIQVRSNKQGFCFGFVEFEVATAVHSALEASPIMINGRQAFVEEKRSTNNPRVNRGRFPSGRGAGFRNEGGRGRGNYGGGRGYGRGDFNNRQEFGNRGNNRGGYYNRGGDGNQRAEHMANDGRMNRAGGLAVRNVALRVPASA